MVSWFRLPNMIFPNLSFVWNTMDSALPAVATGRADKRTVLAASATAGSTITSKEPTAPVLTPTATFRTAEEL